MLDIKPTSVVRLLVVATLAGLCLSSVWFQIQAKGTYVEGIEREPTLWANYTIDGDVEVIELEISNATPLMVYWLERDNVQDPNSSNSSNTENPNNGSEQDEEEGGDSFLNLSRARIIVKILAILCCLLELACVIRPKKITRGVAIGVWFAGLFALTILVPVSVVTGFSSDGMQPGDGFDTDEKNGAKQFAHGTFDSGLEVSPVAIVWSFESEGYDLGLVEEQHRDSVRQSPPEEGEHGADSFIRFAGDVSIVTSEGVWFWLSIPLFLILITMLDGIVNRILETKNNLEQDSEDLLINEENES
ncbi:MAG TPA: hypothetical protein HA340_00015 [Candidatus Thalassarchaeaceae archaeon]|nr:hypothetical protein [Candidatus Thalassarchaeaceae archaeon]HIH82310.1 hypothetical protein [Candidatus Thalassarchaeaceae archaeon]|tara:strand:- start:442 stop:1350 length:909 start_codon:yes stop_codon:yes gene_type:complete